MDAVAYTMAATSTVISRKVTILTVGCVFSGAWYHPDPAFNSFHRRVAGNDENTVVLTALPFLVILLVKVGGLFAG